MFQVGPARRGTEYANSTSARHHIAYFVSAITGVDFDVSQRELLAHRLGVPVKEVHYYKGQIVGPQSPRPKCFWSFKKEYADTYYLDDVLQEHILVARDIRGRIGMPLPQDIRFFISLYVGGSTSENEQRFYGVSFSRQMLRELGELVDDLEIDLNFDP